MRGLRDLCGICAQRPPLSRYAFPAGKIRNTVGGQTTDASAAPPHPCLILSTPTRPGNGHSETCTRGWLGG